MAVLKSKAFYTEHKREMVRLARRANHWAIRYRTRLPGDPSVSLLFQIDHERSERARFMRIARLDARREKQAAQQHGPRCGCYYCD